MKTNPTHSPDTTCLPKPAILGGPGRFRHEKKKKKNLGSRKEVFESHQITPNFGDAKRRNPQIGDHIPKKENLEPEP